MRRLTNLFRESASLTWIKKSSEKLLQPSLTCTGWGEEPMFEVQAALRIIISLWDLLGYFDRT